MKENIHPDYHPVVFMDSTTGFKFLSGSTKTSQETVEWEDGNTYPVIRVEVTSDSHPFYTGRQKFTQADGRVDRFNKNTVSKTQTLRNNSNLVRTLVYQRFRDVFLLGGHLFFVLECHLKKLSDRHELCEVIPFFICNMDVYIYCSFNVGMIHSLLNFFD